MQAISTTPPSALPPQRAPELTDVAKKAFAEAEGQGAQSRNPADNGSDLASGEDARGLQTAESQARPRPPAVAPESEQSALDQRRPDQRQSGRDSLLDRARDIINKFDVTNLSEREFSELRATLEPLGIGRGRNLVDISV